MRMPHNVAPPSTIKQRRSDSTCGRWDISTPTKLVPEQSATVRFLPTLTKCESSTGSFTAIKRQFSQSSPSIQGSISSWRGKPRAWTVFVQWRNTRSTSRRSSSIHETHFDSFEGGNLSGKGLTIGQHADRRHRANQHYERKAEVV